MPDKEIKVPNIGEFKNVEVIEVLASVGQLISKNDPLITIESDKSSVEIPSSFDGKVKSLNVKVGDKVSEGNNILVLVIDEESNKKTGIKKKIQPQEEKKKVKKKKKQNLKKKKIIQVF